MMVSWAVSGHAAWARNNHGLNVTDLGTQHSLSTTSGNSTEPHYTAVSYTHLTLPTTPYV